MPRLSASRSHTPRSPASHDSPQPSSRKKRSRDEDEVEEIVEDDAGDDDDDDDGSDGEDEYEVERIERADFDKVSGSHLYYVKWKGYPSSDNTWEPEENILATDLINKFWENHPSSKQRDKKEALLKQQKEQDQQAKSKKKDKRRASRNDDDDDEVEEEEEESNGRRSASTSGPPRGSKNKQRTSRLAESDDHMDVDDPAEEVPTDEEFARLQKVFRQKYDSLDSWEDKVDKITNLSREPDGDVVAYVQFNGGLEVPYPLKTLHEKCPQQMLAYYASKLRFFNKGTGEMSPVKASPSTSTPGKGTPKKGTPNKGKARQSRGR